MPTGGSTSWSSIIWLVTLSGIAHLLRMTGFAPVTHTTRAPLIDHEVSQWLAFFADITTL
tara:strand:- start:304 stop:483 length:180 start_codon:yes stop_codon:yes gene_type:complete